MINVMFKLNLKINLTSLLILMILMNPDRGLLMLRFCSLTMTNKTYKHPKTCFKPSTARQASM